MIVVGSRWMTGNQRNLTGGCPARGSVLSNPSNVWHLLLPKFYKILYSSGLDGKGLRRNCIQINIGRRLQGQVMESLEAP
jgi:hypothetical protein